MSLKMKFVLKRFNNIAWLQIENEIVLYQNLTEKIVHYFERKKKYWLLFGVM